MTKKTIFFSIRNNEYLVLIFIIIFNFFIDKFYHTNTFYLPKAVVDIYNFNPREAEKNINLAINLNKNENLYSTINTIKLISTIINFRIRSFIKM